MSRVLRKPDFCICENIGADQLCSKCIADQRLSFRYTDSTMTLLKSEISSFKPASAVSVQAGLCRTCWETQIVGFLMQMFIHGGRHIDSRCTEGWEMLCVNKMHSNRSDLAQRFGRSFARLVERSILAANSECIFLNLISAGNFKRRCKNVFTIFC